LGVIGQGLALGTLDLLELVDLGALAVARAADPVGEQGLEVGVAHRLFFSGGRSPGSGSARVASTRPQWRQTRFRSRGCGNDAVRATPVQPPIDVPARRAYLSRAREDSVPKSFAL